MKNENKMTPLKTIKKYKSKTKGEIEIEDNAINACAIFLKSMGWNCLVGGFQGIEQNFGKYRFRLVFDFVGKPPKRLNKK